MQNEEDEDEGTMRIQVIAAPGEEGPRVELRLRGTEVAGQNGWTARERRVFLRATFGVGGRFGGFLLFLQDRRRAAAGLQKSRGPGAQSVPGPGDEPPC